MSVLRRLLAWWRFGRHGGPRGGLLEGRYRRRECLICGRPLLRTGHLNHQHTVCLWAVTAGHAAGFCSCTGYDDPYEAGTAYFTRPRTGEFPS